MFLVLKNSHLIHVLLKNLKFLWVIVKIFYTFLENFIKECEVYVRVDYKVETKIVNWKFWKDKKSKKYFKGTKNKTWNIYRVQNDIYH
jgi:hypothetical protein